MDLHHYTYYSFEEWGRGYIGVRSCKCLPEEDTKYFGSFSDKSFNPTQKVILKSNYETRKKADEDEIILHNFYNVAKNPHFANKAKATSAGFCTAGSTLTKETRKKLSKAHAGKKLSKETRRKMSLIRAGRAPTEEHRRKNSEAHIGKTLTEETKQKISVANTGKKHAEEFKQRVREVQTGLRWFVNENNETRKSRTPPGPGWQIGRVWRQS